MGNKMGVCRSCYMRVYDLRRTLVVQVGAVMVEVTRLARRTRVVAMVLLLLLPAATSYSHWPQLRQPGQPARPTQSTHWADISSDYHSYSLLNSFLENNFRWAFWKLLKYV